MECLIFHVCLGNEPVCLQNNDLSLLTDEDSVVRFTTRTRVC